MRKFSFTLLAILMIAANGVFAQETTTQVLNAGQVAKLDLSGKWSGKRNQYSWDKKTFIESFQYEFNLKQEGNQVTGTSTIINSNGEYADMRLEGMIIGNKFHFREYEVKNAIRPDGKVWCYKSGELNISRMGDDIKLTGSTPSFMETYNYPCSGGETDLKKLDNSANLAVLVQAAPSTDARVENSLSINAYPNPFVDNANINYTIKEGSKVRLEVYDISGKFMTNLFEGNQNAGTYTYTFNGKNYASSSGVYIVKMTINDAIYSQQMVQLK